MRFNFLSAFFVITIFASCKKSINENALFTLLESKDTGVDFANNLTEVKGTNVFTFRNYYNGGGVAIGDVNNDGLNDVYLTSNQGDNQLLLNKGNFKFENITEKAGVKGTKYWSTGVTMVDINNDGWLDIYVCNSGNANGSETENELFVNQKNGTFKDEAIKYGLADRGLTTHAVFFDYDLDGDLDCYILNNSFRPIGSFDFTKALRTEIDEIGGDRLYRNDNGKFKNVTQAAGIYSSDIGFGLGVSVVDINQDGYPDIYVSNDFFERDYLYINQKNGKFSEKIQSATGHLSLASMGSDIADINNDGEYDIFTTEMLPEGDQRLKLVTSFETYDVFKLKQKDGYYNQLMQNNLQLNNGDSTFSEIAFSAGVGATDWSWGALIFDMNNDGWKDIFVSNGIYKDLTNQDYIDFLGNRDNMKKIAEGKKFDYKEFTDKMTSTPIPNYAFLNNKNLTFTNKAEDFGLADPSFSNGAAYGDLDNDGDADLVVNNVNMPVFIYKNNSEKIKNNFLLLNLKGSQFNTFGVGSTLKVFVDGKPLVYYHQPARGFQSSIPPNLITIGVGKKKIIDSVQLIWPDGKYETRINQKVNQKYNFDYASALKKYNFNKPEVKKILKPAENTLFTEIPKQIEDEYIDFDQERLMLQMLSTENPYMAKGDVNGDGLTDFYFGNAKGSAAAIYIQQKNGQFKKTVPADFSKQVYLENAGAAFADFDGDNNQDLIIAYGGNAEEAGTNIYYPRFFTNDGKGNFTWDKSKNITAPINASVLLAQDFDKDGDIDLFIGGRSVPGIYGSKPQSYIFKNDGKGKFTDASTTVFGNNTRLGMVTAAQWADLENDGYPDLVLTGNWMGIKIYQNKKGKFSEDKSLANYKGWWSSLQIDDINGDGKLDILAGNIGLNTKFNASADKPMHIYVKDFDENGTKECITSYYKTDGKPYVFHMRNDLVGQMPTFKKRFLRFEDYAGKTFEEVFPDDMLKDAEIQEMNYLQSAVFINEGNRKYKSHPFPHSAQLSSINSIITDDIDEDGVKEIIIGGNFYGFKPEFGRLDANYGQIYRFTNKGWKYFDPKKSGLMLNGQIKSSLIINVKGRKYYLFGRNNDTLKAYTIN